MPTKDEVLQQAACLNIAKRYQQVVNLLTGKLLQQYNCANLYAERAMAWYFLHELDSVLEDCNTALAIDNSCYKAYNYAGNYWLAKYNNNEAAACYNKAIALSPSYAEAYNNRGVLYCRQLHYTNAVEDYATAVRLNPVYAAAYNNMGCALCYTGEYDKAIEYFGKAIAIDDSDPIYYNNRALALDGKKQYVPAADNFTTAIQLSPLSSMLHYRRAITWRNMQEDEKALQDFTRVIELDASFEYGWAYFKLGEIYQAKKNYTHAIANYDKAVEVNPCFTDALNNRGITRHALKEYKKAVSDFTSALSLDTNNITALYNRGLSMFELGEYRIAFTNFNRVVELNINSADAYNARGLAWYNIKQPDKAADDFTSSINIDPTFADAYKNRALALYAMKEEARALDDFSMALNLNPGFAEAYYTRGIIYAARKEYNTAIADFSMAIQLNTNYVLAYNNRGLLYYITNDYTRAIEDFTKQILLDVKNAQAYDNAGLVWYCKKNYERAIEYHSRAITLDANRANAYYNRANALYAAKQYEDAIKDYNTAITLNRNFNFAGYNISMAKAKTGVPVNIDSLDNSTLLYFIEKQLQSVDAANKNAIRQVAFDILDAADGIKEYAEGNTNHLETVAYQTCLVAADVIAMDKNATLQYFNADMLALKDDDFLPALFVTQGHESVYNAYNAGRYYQENSTYIGSFFSAAAPPVKALHKNNQLKATANGSAKSSNNGGDCTLVIQSNFFAGGHNEVSINDTPLSLQNSVTNRALKTQQLHKVLYYHAATGNITGDTNNEVKNHLQKFKHGLSTLVMLGGSNKKTGAAINSLVYRFINEIKYFFKPAEHAAENELRVIEYVAPGDERIQMEKTGSLPRRLYIESSNKIQPFIDAIIPGKNVPDPRQWLYLEIQMRKNGNKQCRLKLPSVTRQKESVE